MKAHRLRVRLTGLAVGLIAVLATGIIVNPAPAQAATKHAISRPYVHNWVFRSTSLNRCVFIEVQGTMVGSWEYLYGDYSTDKDSLRWTGMKLQNPSISATGWPISGAGCDSTRHWNMKAKLSQGWYQQQCRLTVTPSASIAAPWSVSAGISPSYACGANKQGHRSTTEGFSTNTLHQYNSGYPISFANDSASVAAGGIGFTGSITVTAHTASSSDTVNYKVYLTLNK